MIDLYDNMLDNMRDGACEIRMGEEEPKDVEVYEVQMDHIKEDISKREMCLICLGLFNCILEAGEELGKIVWEMDRMIDQRLDARGQEWNR